MENDLRHALERNELVVHYQPQVDLYNGNIIGMEALLRWQASGNRADFTQLPSFPWRKKPGLIIPIGEWVLRTACARLKAWMDEGLPKIRVGVNLSSRQFNQNNLDEVVAAVLRDTGLPPDCLELELTERMIMQDAESTITILHKLRALGVQFSIDDFGTGYSSLSYLKRFPIDRIKIDQSFVREITSNPEDAAVSQAIISLSHSLNLKTIAEGVETAEQQEYLRTCSATRFRDSISADPVPEQEMSRLLKEGVKLESRHEFSAGRTSSAAAGRRGRHTQCHRPCFAFGRLPHSSRQPSPRRTRSADNTRRWRHHLGSAHAGNERHRTVTQGQETLPRYRTHHADCPCRPAGDRRSH